MRAKRTVDLLHRLLGRRPARGRSNGLAKLAGTWSASDFSEFERVTASFEENDEDSWNRGLSERRTGPTD